VAVKDVFKVELYPDPKSGSGMSGNPYYPGEDITPGILNVEIVEGVDIYEGPYQQIDSGQFTIVSRNPNLDPKINTNLKYNSRIAFIDDRSGEFFRGYVTNVDVQYQRNDDPIITITGTDIFGVLQRIVVDETLYDNIIALSDGPTWQGATFEEFCTLGGGALGDFVNTYLETDALSGTYPVPIGFGFYVDSSNGLWTTISPAGGNLGYAPARYIPQVGETLLDVINKYATTNFNKIYAKGEFGYNIINVFPFVKYNGAYWTPISDPYLTYTGYDFSSDPADNAPYRTILVDNGYNRTINQIDLSNEYKFISGGEVQSQSDNLGPYISSESTQNFAVTKASVSTFFPDNHPKTLDAMGTEFAQSVFQLVGTPSDEVQKITFDNGRYEDIQDGWTYSNYIVNQMVRIKHQISPNETINKIYEIAGITHSITPDNWEMGFSFKPSDAVTAYNYKGQSPTLQLNATSGDANFNFTASIVNYDTSKISSVLWDLNQRDANETTSNNYYSATTGEKFKNGLPRTGLTQTWNFDDDGILAPYSFNPDRSFDFTGETDNRNGGYGPGNWWVTAYITLTNGFTFALQQGITVGTPAVTANFGWSQNLTTNFGQVQFTDTSTNHETGEPDSYLWNFGDGTTSTLQNPSKTYTGDGTSYTVSLTVFTYGPGFPNPVKVYNTKTETITLAQPTMVPNYTYTVFNSTVTFTNTSTNVGLEEPDAYLWDFGDGTTSTLKNPTKTYPGYAGDVKTFNVSLTTRNMFETTATVTKTITFTMTFDVGNYPVNSIRFRSASSYALPANTYGTPYMWNLKALTTGNGSNLMYLNPVTRSNTSNIVWYEMDGTIDETNDPLNLTRDTGPSSQLGLAALSANNNPTSFTLSTTLPSPALNLQTFSLNLRDITAGNTGNWRTIYIDINTNLGWRQVGYFRLGRNRVGDIDPVVGDTFPKITNATRTMIPTRVLPLNNLNFDYTQQPNSRTVNFTTTIPGPWNWNFGDGTTSTLQNPTKTYSSNELSTYNVSLNGVTEKVKLRFPIPFSFRYIRIRQKPHNGLGQYDTPPLFNFSLQTAATGSSTTNGPYTSSGGLTNPQSIASQKYIGAGGFTVVNGGSVISLIGSQSLTNDTGIRFKWEQSNPPDPIPYQTQWDLAIDYKELITTGIEEITMDINGTLTGGGPNFTSNAYLTEYEIFASAHNANVTSQQQGDPALIPGWVKVGEFKNLSGLVLNSNARFQQTMIPQYT
jgi:PKD repeat protein